MKLMERKNGGLRSKVWGWVEFVADVLLTV